ncbi:MAG: hypothetical protein WBB00_29175 [Mycobacterium sp.]
MPANTVSLTRLNGFSAFHCLYCGAVIVGEGGPGEHFCEHVSVFVDWVGESQLGPAAADGLEEKLDEIEADVLDELASLFGDDTIVFELSEQARGGGHDGSGCLVALTAAEFGDSRG